MPTNDFIGFASSGSANILSQADFAAAAEQSIGVQPGPASSKLANKVLRQGANMAAALGRVAAARGYDALDNGDLNTLQNTIDDTISLGTFNHMFFSQTSGAYTAPRTGVYRITLKGGGGGGGGTNTSQYRLGAGGGEGAELTFYVTLTKKQSYPYVIGAGGTAGTDSASSPTNGGNGGITSFNSIYSVAGGNGGNFGSSSAMGFGGAGGSTYNAPAGTPVYFKPGIAGQSNIYGDQSNNKWLQYGCSGGGRGGCSQQSATGIYGGGGRGTFEIGFGGTLYPPTVGGDGYILIEYAG